MKIRVLGCFGSRVPGRSTSCLMVDERLLLDAGSISSTLYQPEQMAIDDILLTHAHIDHIIDLAFLADNVLSSRTSPVRIWAAEPVLDTVRKHLFNNVIWPDFSKIPTPEKPAIQLLPLPDGKQAEISGYQVRWEETTHTIYTTAYCLERDGKALFYSADTTTTEAIWKMTNRCENLKIAFIETSFPNRMENLAKISGHLTPAMLKVELEKFGDRDIPIKIFHMKPQFLDELRAELAAIGDDRLQVLDGGEVFQL